MSDFLYKTILNEAKNSFSKNVTKENYQEWVDHWFETAEKLKNNFSQDGLVETANSMHAIIEEQKSIMSRSEGVTKEDNLKPCKEMIEENKENEIDRDILPDDYPIYGDYMYVADGKPYRSEWHGITVKHLKQHGNFKEIRRYSFK